jgi:hypothetical protein
LMYDVLHSSSIVSGVANGAWRVVHHHPSSHKSCDLAHIGKSCFNVFMPDA